MRVFVDGYGCTLNQGEGRRIAQRLSETGHHLVPRPQEADACILVTCTVVETTERKMLRRMRELASPRRRLVVTGCMAAVQADRIREAVPAAAILPPTQPEALTALFPPVGDASFACFEPPSTVDGIVPIAQGCLARCSYCISTVARGALRSVPLAEVVAQVRQAVARGRREIRLSSLDTGQYGRDLGLSLADLLHAVCRVEGAFRVRVGMMSPMMLRPILGRLVDAYREEKAFRFLHLPVQSGNDEVLRRMRRGYTVERFWEAVDAFRSHVRTLSLATDVVVGFPGESDREFEDTLDLVEDLRPDVLNITRFSPRPGTPAAAMEDRVPGWKLKERSRRLTALRFRISRRIHEERVGSTVEVLTTEVGKAGTTVARTDDYRPVVLPGELPLGASLPVRLESASDVYLRGRPLGPLPEGERHPRDAIKEGQVLSGLAAPWSSGQ